MCSKVHEHRRLKLFWHRRLMCMAKTRVFHSAKRATWYLAPVLSVVGVMLFQRFLMSIWLLPTRMRMGYPSQSCVSLVVMDHISICPGGEDRSLFLSVLF